MDMSESLSVSFHCSLYRRARASTALPTGAELPCRRATGALIEGLKSRGQAHRPSPPAALCNLKFMPGQDISILCFSPREIRGETKIGPPVALSRRASSLAASNSATVRTKGTLLSSPPVSTPLMVTFFTSSDVTRQSWCPRCPLALTIVTTHPKNSLISLRNATRALPTIASAGSELPSPASLPLVAMVRLSTQKAHSKAHSG